MPDSDRTVNLFVVKCQPATDRLAHQCVALVGLYSVNIQVRDDEG